jgi:hypothetical protein
MAARKTPKTRRERCLDKLAAQAQAGDVGANAELNAAMIRDADAAGHGHLYPLDYHDAVIAGIRKLRRRQLEWLGR